MTTVTEDYAEEEHFSAELGRVTPDPMMDATGNIDKNEKTTNEEDIEQYQLTEEQLRRLDEEDEMFQRSLIGRLYPMQSPCEDEEFLDDCAGDEIDLVSVASFMTLDRCDFDNDDDDHHIIGDGHDEELRVRDVCESSAKGATQGGLLLNSKTDHTGAVITLRTPHPKKGYLINKHLIKQNQKHQRRNHHNNQQQKKSSQSRNSRTFEGMLCIAMGTVCIGTVGAMVKQNGGSVVQLMAGRYTVQLVLAMIAWWKISRNRISLTEWIRQGHSMHEDRMDIPHLWYGDTSFIRGFLWLRGALYFLMILFWWRVLEVVNIGDAEAFLFIGPLLTIVLAKMVLHEPLPDHWLLSSMLTVCGVVCVCQPPFVLSFFKTAVKMSDDIADLAGEDGNDDDDSNDNYNGQQLTLDDRPMTVRGVVLLSSCALLWAVVSLISRVLSTLVDPPFGVHWIQVEMVSSVQAVFVWIPIFFASSEWIFSRKMNDYLLGSDDEWDWSMTNLLWMLAIGLLAFIGLCLNVRGYQIADATKVAWMEYWSLIFAFILQWLVFRVIPDLIECVGVSLLFANCLISMMDALHYSIEPEQWFDLSNVQLRSKNGRRKSERRSNQWMDWVLAMAGFGSLKACEQSTKANLEMKEGNAHQKRLNLNQSGNIEAVFDEETPLLVSLRDQVVHVL